MSNIGFNCDVCGRQVQGCTFVNGMKFCAKCYQETFGNTSVMQMCADEIAGYLKRIADLEKQLAEKDKLINDYADEHAMLQYKIADLVVKEIKAEEFAIEQLESVKEHISSGLAFDVDVQIWFEEYIDQQIKELRGQE